MSRTTDAVLAELDTVIQVWTENSVLSTGDLALPAITAKRGDLAAREDAVESARTTLSRLIDEESDVRDECEQIITRASSGVRAILGPDSPQYAQVGGTRASERKPSSRGGTGSTPGAGSHTP